MSGVSVTVDDAAVTAALSRLRGRLGDLRPAMEDIGANLVGEIDLGFRAQSDPWGNPWAKHSEITASRRRKGKGRGGDKILRDTGVLANSISHQVDANSVVVWTNLKYAPTHQFGARQGAFGRTRRGGPIPWGDIPRRAFLPLNPAGDIDLPPDQLAGILDTLSRHLKASS